MSDNGKPIHVIAVGHSQRHYWRRCWQYRELVWFLARRDFVVKYRQTQVGLLWLLARPLQQVFIFTLLFGVIANLPSGTVSYPVLVMSGVVLWEFFSAIVTQSNKVLINNQSLITKVNFPRILLPIGTVLPNFFDLLVNLLALAAIMLWYNAVPTWRILLLPVPIGMMAVLALGFGMWFGALAVRYRDFAQLSTFLLQFFFLLSPLGYSSDILLERLGVWTFVYYLNPLVAIIDLGRWCLLPAGAGSLPDPVMLALSLAAGLGFFLSGQWVFRRLERTFADVI